MRLEYFQMVDRLVALDPDAGSVRADCKVPDASPVFEGHFPGYPLLPGVLMVETMAQTGGWLLLARARFTRMAFLAQVREAKLRAFVTPGRALVASARLVHDGSGYAVMEGRLEADGKTVAEADLTYRVVPFPNPDLRGQMLDVAQRVGVAEEWFHGG
ncbi:MAG: beta-hydroxyacyl-ACP dehydratase [Rhodospirillales bacterium]|jgi:3-hydroxyacyl-[acyl-carrier-protein] dehydratase|nr:beta-hydroxyacyl-ACP dehydratase [Rhodospirillales bacterium]